ncbi:MAG: nicotinamide-nucleotide amidase [Chloroflexota bacterium]|jgi:PncC family amidohydrolase|nr:nicotinamide-nucleotide amidase [Chloroflexota bacterium]
MDPLKAEAPPTDEELVALAAELQAASVAAGLSIATAESCTGGLVGHILTQVDGSSGYYLGGAVSYSDGLKRSVLGVTPEALERHGAVSAQVAVAMAEGARDRFGADITVSVTGIAGPGGGSGAKPVGLTYVAVASAAGHEVRRFHWSGDRDANKRHSAGAALRLLALRVQETASARDAREAASPPDAHG